jgi:hypothetical protein
MQNLVRYKVSLLESQKTFTLILLIRSFLLSRLPAVFSFWEMA